MNPEIKGQLIALGLAIPLTLLIVFLIVVFTSCTKEYSRECSGCIMTTEMYVGDVRISTTRQAQDCYSGKGDSTYYRGDTMFIRKMKCK